jgi:hypothetical protein
VYSARLEQDGSLAPWQATLPLPATVSYAVALGMNSAVHLVLQDEGASPPYSRRTYSGAVGTDGLITAWTRGAPLVTGRTIAALVADGVGGALLVGGGDGTTLFATIERSAISTAPGATFTGWSVVGSLPAPLAETAASVHRHRLCVIGGRSSSGEVAATACAPLTP